jgi:hypothetical protein
MARLVRKWLRHDNLTSLNLRKPELATAQRGNARRSNSHHCALIDQHAHSLTETYLRVPAREMSFEFTPALRNCDAAFQQHRAQLIDQRGSFSHKSIANSM